MSIDDAPRVQDPYLEVIVITPCVMEHRRDKRDSKKGMNANPYYSILPPERYRILPWAKPMLKGV